MVTELSPGVYRIGDEIDSEGNRTPSIVTGEAGVQEFLKQVRISAKKMLAELDKKHKQ